MYASYVERTRTGGRNTRASSLWEVFFKLRRLSSLTMGARRPSAEYNRIEVHVQFHRNTYVCKPNRAIVRWSPGQNRAEDVGFDLSRRHRVVRRATRRTQTAPCACRGCCRLVGGLEVFPEWLPNPQDVRLHRGRWVWRGTREVGNGRIILLPAGSGCWLRPSANQMSSCRVVSYTRRNDRAVLIVAHASAEAAILRFINDNER